LLRNIWFEGLVFLPKTNIRCSVKTTVLTAATVSADAHPDRGDPSDRARLRFRELLKRFRCET